jgi:hypothetical protein
MSDARLHRAVCRNVRTPSAQRGPGRPSPTSCRNPDMPSLPAPHERRSRADPPGRRQGAGQPVDPPGFRNPQRRNPVPPRSAPGSRLPGCGPPATSPPGSRAPACLQRQRCRHLQTSAHPGSLPLRSRRRKPRPAADQPPPWCPASAIPDPTAAARHPAAAETRDPAALPRHEARSRPSPAPDANGCVRPPAADRRSASPRPVARHRRSAGRCHRHGAAPGTSRPRDGAGDPGPSPQPGRPRRRGGSDPAPVDPRDPHRAATLTRNTHVPLPGACPCRSLRLPVRRRRVGMPPPPPAAMSVP